MFNFILLTLFAIIRLPKKLFITATIFHSKLDRYTNFILFFKNYFLFIYTTYFLGCVSSAVIAKERPSTKIENVTIAEVGKYLL